MSERATVCQLRERIQQEATEHDIPSAHAAGLVWLAEGGEQNNHSARVWERAFAVLGVDIEAEAEQARKYGYHEGDVEIVPEGDG